MDGRTTFERRKNSIEPPERIRSIKSQYNDLGKAIPQLNAKSIKKPKKITTGYERKSSFAKEAWGSRKKSSPKKAVAFFAKEID